MPKTIGGRNVFPHADSVVKPENWTKSNADVFVPKLRPLHIGDAMNIRPLKMEHLDAVTAIHVERFPNSRSTQLGKPFLRKMYRWFITNQPDLALVATIDDQVVGFAVGSIGGYGRRVFRYALLQVAWGLVSHPKLPQRRDGYRRLSGARH